MALEYERLVVTTEGSQCRILLNAAESGNALDDTMRQELLQALLSAQADDTVRVVLITGAGDHFCSGLPAGEFEDGRPGSPDTPWVAPAPSEHLLGVEGRPDPAQRAVRHRTRIRS